MAPEIWKNNLYDYRCDIYSLGCVVYEMCSLRVPFQGVSLQDLYRKIKRGFINWIPASYSDELYEIIKIMMTKDHKERPSADELL